jgi:hypothetical protein
MTRRSNPERSQFIKTALYINYEFKKFITKIPGGVISSININYLLIIKSKKSSHIFEATRKYLVKRIN